MQKKQAETLGDVLQQYLKAIGADKKIKELRLLDAWEVVVGRTISRDTLDIYIKDGILYVKFRSPLIRNEVMMHRSLIIQHLNENVGDSIVKDIKIR